MHHVLATWLARSTMSPSKQQQQQQVTDNNAPFVRWLVDNHKVFQLMLYATGVFVSFFLYDYLMELLFHMEVRLKPEADVSGRAMSVMLTSRATLSASSRRFSCSSVLVWARSSLCTPATNKLTYSRREPRASCSTTSASPTVAVAVAAIIPAGASWAMPGLRTTMWPSPHCSW
eukprot:scaffold1300_cov317-Prasinococcus_capsulatus_cf.AAC.10